MKKIYLAFTLVFILFHFNSNAQSYLPLSGGTLTGSLNINLGSGNQLQIPYLGFDSNFPQPGASNNVAIFPNATSLALDFIGYNNGWHFVPFNGATYASPVVTIDPSGNTNIIGKVGIGTASITNIPSGYQLAVNGGAIATSMVVQLYNSWPDYVFKPTYRLPALSYIKTYIDQNHHLPDMPSAEDVAKNGLNLGETDKLLTQKVEELTLYLIDKDKELADEKTVIGGQQRQLVAQQQQINQQQDQIQTQQKVNQSLQQQIDDLKNQLSTLIKSVK